MKRILILGTAVALATMPLLSGCGRKPVPRTEPALPAAKVRVQTVEQRPRIATEDVVGTVQATLRAELQAKVSGRVEKMLAVPGQKVKAGQLLVQLDAREIQARLDQAVAMRDQARDELERLRNLLAQQAVSRQDFDNAEARQRVTVANANEAETMLGYTRITAPFDGTITRKYADVGDLAAPGKSLLAMEDSQALRLEADVPEALIASIEPGGTFPVRVSALTNELRAKVSEIAPAGDPASRTFLVKFDLPANAGVRAGQFGRVSIPVGQSSTLRLPAEVVIQRGQMEIVFVVADGHARLRLVKTGRRVGDELELVSGLEPGETVVVEGAASLRDGQPVEILR